MGKLTMKVDGLHEGGRVKGRRGRQNRPRNIVFAGAGRRMPRRVGEVFEAAFVTKAASLGFGVAKLLGRQRAV